MIEDTLIDEIVAEINKGSVILYPTDTIWGIGCDATNEESIQQIYKIKGRSFDKPLLILVESIEMLKDYVESIHPRIETLLTYHKRPLTLIYDKAKNLPKIAIAKDGSIGIRISQDPLTKAIMQKLGKPLISTSANESNQVSPRFFREIADIIKTQVNYIVPIKQDDETIHEPSVIAKVDKNGELIFLRT